MTNFKQLREAARNLAVRATGDDGEEAKLNDLPSDQSKLDDADENNRNPDGTAEFFNDTATTEIYTKTDNGTYTLATESKYRSHPRAAADDKEAARLDKIARAAAAREKDQAAQKEKAKEKHYAASKKSRESVKHFGNKDQFGRPKNEEVALGGGLQEGYKFKKTKTEKNKSEEGNQTIVHFDIMQNGKKIGQIKVDDYFGKMVGTVHGKNIPNGMHGHPDTIQKDFDGFMKSKTAQRLFKGNMREDVEQTDESLRQRADDAMTFSNRQAAYSTAFKKAHGRGPSKQELRDAGCGKGGDCPAGVKKYQAAMSKLRPASRSGIKDKFVHKEGLEQKLAKIRESKGAVEIEITENTIDDIKKLTTLSQAGTVRFADGSSAKVTPQSATALLQTHGNLNTNNQKKFAKKLASSATEFAKLEKFALQQAKLSGRLYQLNNL
jgi:hypothetical protein